MGWFKKKNEKQESVSKINTETDSKIGESLVNKEEIPFQVYKALGLKPLIGTPKWHQEIKVLGETMYLELFHYNIKIIEEKIEPEYSELISIYSTNGIEDPSHFHSVVKIYIDQSKNMSFLKEDIEEYSKKHGYDLWTLMSWRGRLVRKS